MTNIDEIIETVIICMRDGKNIDEALSSYDLTEEETNQCVKIAEGIIKLYDGKFPIDHLNLGDICIDPFGCNPCLITNINDRSIHVLYFNGKTHKFRRSQEGQFKRLGVDLKNKLDLLMDDCQLLYKTSIE